MNTLETKYSVKEDFSLSLIKACILRYAKIDFAGSLPYYEIAAKLAPPHAKDHLEKQIRLVKKKAEEQKAKK